MMGARPSPEAVSVMAKMGLQLADHESQPLTAQLVRHADIIWTMTRSHRQAIVAQWPEASSRTMVLSRGPGGHCRPDRRAGRVLRDCAKQIKGAAGASVEELDL